jgi:hypothetical protein
MLQIVQSRIGSFIRIPRHLVFDVSLNYHSLKYGGYWQICLWIEQIVRESCLWIWFDFETGEFRPVSDSVMESITVPHNIAVIRDSCFEKWLWFLKLWLASDSQLARIGSHLFGGHLLRQIFAHGNVETIGNLDFELCCSLSAIHFEWESKLAWIGSRIDSSCSGGGVKGDRCFESGYSFLKIIIESHSELTEIESPPFYGSLLESIDLPRKL